MEMDNDTEDTTSRENHHFYLGSQIEVSSDFMGINQNINKQNNKLCK